MGLTFSAICGDECFHFSLSVFGKALPFRKEVVIGPRRVMWSE